jgi:hypothetical protein
VRIARVELAPRIANADHRAAIEHIVGIALVFHPTAVGKAIFIKLAEPLLAATFKFGVIVAIVGGHERGALRSRMQFVHYTVVRCCAMRVFSVLAVPTAQAPAAGEIAP